MTKAEEVEVGLVKADVTAMGESDVGSGFSSCSIPAAFTTSSAIRQRLAERGAVSAVPAPRTRRRQHQQAAPAGPTNGSLMSDGAGLRSGAGNFPPENFGVAERLKKLLVGPCQGRLKVDPLAPDEN